MARTVLATMMIVANAGAACSAAPPQVGNAEPAPEWNAKFAGLEGWIGGDGVYSVVVGPHRILWLFSDSLIGHVRDGGRPGAVMVNNTIGVQAGPGKDAAIRFVAGQTKDHRPTALLVPADGKGWFWLQAAARVGDRLFLFLAQIERSSDPGVFGFQQIGQWLGTVDNPEDEPEKWRLKQRRLPFATFTPTHHRSWGSAVLAGGGQVYIYGYDEPRGQGLGKRQLTVARVPAEKLEDFAAWRFRTAGGWSERATDAAPLAAGLATEFSVSPVPGGAGYVLVYTENGLAARIIGRFADAPEGPWSAPQLLYTCPEMAQDKGLFSYAAKGHPWATGNHELLVSYCVNAWEFGRLFRDERVYRPKFVRVELRPGR